ncbi:homeobox-domain-containing protein [Hesseltinella vesiculosa]|uniref:Homeobox-domain-containing protein n=1 Tax=Hesseltinella vesiculosa TaxID=101127 RepID=A0A1X2G7P9_9FUNG|nr:homeobox-domain-containing protein [Hesseltinella vesiculosa]
MAPYSSPSRSPHQDDYLDVIRGPDHLQSPSMASIASSTLSSSAPGTPASVATSPSLPHLMMDDPLYPMEPAAAFPAKPTFQHPFNPSTSLPLPPQPAWQPMPASSSSLYNTPPLHGSHITITSDLICSHYLPVPSVHILKAKRKRASPAQIMVLEHIFDHTAFPSTALRQELGEKLGMNPRAVQIWFQNKRQASKRLQSMD